MIAKTALIRALTPHSFLPQSIGPDLFMVRKSDVTGVWERVEFEVAGRRNEAMVVGLAISVVWNVVAQMQGLVQSGELPEVCSDPQNGRIELASLKEAEAWAEQVGAIAPQRAAALAREKGPALLEKTEVARTPAAQAFRMFVEPASDLRSIRDEASTQQRQLIDNALSRPFAIPSEELRPIAVFAIAALVRMGDREVIELGQIATSPATDPRARLDQLLAVPDLAIWKVRLLVDMIVRKKHG